MSPRRELTCFAATLAVLLAGFFGDALWGARS